MKKIFSDLASNLQSKGFDIEEVPATDAVPVDQLLVHLEQNKSDWDLHLELAFISDLEKQASTTGTEENADYLQFFVPLPVQCPSEKAGDMARLIAFANNALPLVGFGYAENQGWVFFRHLMVWVKSAANDQIVVETITMIEYLIETFSSALGDLASGARSLDQIIADDVHWA